MKKLLAVLFGGVFAFLGLTATPAQAATSGDVFFSNSGDNSSSFDCYYYRGSTSTTKHKLNDGDSVTLKRLDVYECDQSFHLEYFNSGSGPTQKANVRYTFASANVPNNIATAVH